MSGGLKLGAGLEAKRFPGVLRDHYLPLRGQGGSWRPLGEWWDTGWHVLRSAAGIPDRCVLFSVTLTPCHFHAFH